MPVMCPACVMEPTNNQAPELAPRASVESEDWHGMSAQEIVVGLGGNWHNGPSSGEMEFTMTGELGPGSGISDWGAGEQDFNEAPQPPSMPFDSPMGNGAPSIEASGMIIPDESSTLHETSTGPTNQHISITSDFVPNNSHEAPSSAPTTATSFTLTVTPGSSAVTISICSPQFPPVSPYPLALFDQPTPQGPQLLPASPTPQISPVPPAQQVRRPRGRPRSVKVSKRGARTGGA